MDALQAILTRRSIRRYEPTPVTEDQLKDLLEAAMAAPSAGNQQPWHFIVVTERRTLDAIAAVHPHAQMLKEAPAAVVVCGDTTSLRHVDFWVQDCAAAVQNILLAATALGLGSCWVGVHPRAERETALRGVFNFPESIVPVAVVALGHGAEVKGPALRYQEERVHRERW